MKEVLRYTTTEDELFKTSMSDCNNCEYAQQYQEVTGKSFDEECAQIRAIYPTISCGLASLAVQSLAKDDLEYDQYLAKVGKGGKNA